MENEQSTDGQQGKSYNADTVDQIIRYESDSMSDEEEIEFFQGLIDNGLAWQLQGHYGRTAEWLIKIGACRR